MLFAYVEGFQSANIVGVVLSVGSAVGAALYKVGVQVTGHEGEGDVPVIVAVVGTKYSGPNEVIVLYPYTVK